MREAARVDPSTGAARMRIAATVAAVVAATAVASPVRSGAQAGAGPARVAPAVVYVELPPPVEGAAPLERGTGFVAASNATASYIVTAAHVANCDTYGNWCERHVNVRLPGGTEVVGDLVYAGASSDTEDYAIVRVARGNLPVATLSDATPAEPVGVLGFPATSSQAAPQLRMGTVSDVQRERKLLVMTIQTEPGDSGGPIFDATSGNVVGIVHGTLGGGAADQRSAVATGVVRNAIADAVANAGGDDTRASASLLFAYAVATADRCDYLKTVATGNEVDELCHQAAVLLRRAIDAGSLDAALRAVDAPSYDFFTGLKEKDAVLATVEAAAAAGNAEAAYTVANHFGVVYQRASDGAAKAAAAANVMRYVMLATDHGDPVAMTLLAMFYDQAAKGSAKNAGESLLGAYDPSWDLGPAKDAAAAAQWTQRAATPLQERIDRGDPVAAFIAAQQFELSPIGQDFSNVGLVAARYVKAVALGSDAALARLSNYSGLTGSVQADIFRALKAAYDDGKTGDFAIALGQMYEQGEGTPVDKHQALLAFRAAGANPLSANIAQLVPNGELIGATLAATPGYRNALASTVRMTIPNPAQGWPDTVRGVVLRSGPDAIVATGAFSLGCDAWARGCHTPSEIEFSDGTRTRSIRLLRAAVADLSDGVALLRVDRANVPAATIGTAVPNLVATACLQPEWGVVLSGAAEHRVLDLGVPFPFQPGAVGCGLFDTRTGALVGMYTDPWHIYNAAGPETIARALSEPHP